MDTFVKGAGSEVRISVDAPFVIIGEKINPTGRKKLAAALAGADYEYVLDLAKAQVAAGADILDVNVGVPGLDEIRVLPKVAKLISDDLDVPICLDSANHEALAAALAVLPGKALINSVNGEERALNRVLPLVKEHGAAVIALTMDDAGIPSDIEGRVAIAGKIIERAAQIGIAEHDVVIDPLALTVGADSDAASVTLGTIEMVRNEFGVNINVGASNVSFGLPDRHTVNQAFLSLAIGKGATCAITDPIKLAGTIRATDLLMGRDKHSLRYLRHYRARQS